MTGLFSLADILLSALSIPVSYTFFINEYPLFDRLLPYVGSEIAFGLILGLFVIISRFSLAIAVFLSLIAWLIPNPPANTPSPSTGLNIAIIQTVLPQHVTSYPGISDGLHYWKTHMIHALQEANQQKVDVAILPESSMPSFHSTATPVVQEILNARHSYPLIAHHYVDTETNGISSQVRFWDQYNHVQAIHEKQNPLPIAEKLIIPGEQASFSLKDFTLASFICSESLDVYNARFRLSTSDIGIVLTNEAEIADTYLPELHLISDKIRAREMGTPILRAGNIRLSTYIDAKGREVVTAKESSWQNLYVTVTSNSDTLYSSTFVAQHILILMTLPILLIRKEKIHITSPPVGIYILIMICMIYAQIAYGYEHVSSEPLKAETPFYIDGFFPARQLGISDATNMEQFSTYVDSSHIPVKDIPPSRGVGIINTIHGEMYITERRGDRITTLSERGFLTLKSADLEQISLSKVLWYTYKSEN